MERTRVMELLTTMDKSVLPDEERVAISGAVELLNKLQYEVCVCAAVKDMDGKIYRGQRWADCIAQITGEGKQVDVTQMGFMTSYNSFILPFGAKKLQDAAGIPSVNAEGFRENNLFPEDLY